MKAGKLVFLVFACPEYISSWRSLLQTFVSRCTKSLLEFAPDFAPQSVKYIWYDGEELASLIFRWLFCDPSERSVAAPCCLAITPGALRSQPQAVVKCADMLSWCYTNDKFERPHRSYSAQCSRHDQAEALGLLTWAISDGSHVLYVSSHSCRHYIENSWLQGWSTQIVKADIYYRIGKKVYSGQHRFSNDFSGNSAGKPQFSLSSVPSLW